MAEKAKKRTRNPIKGGCRVSAASDFFGDDARVKRYYGVVSRVIDETLCRVYWEDKTNSLEKMVDLTLEQDKYKLKVRMKGQNKVVEADDDVDFDCEQTSRFGRKFRKVNYQEVVGDVDEVEEVVAGSSGIIDGEGGGDIDGEIVAGSSGIIDGEGDGDIDGEIVAESSRIIDGEGDGDIDIGDEGVVGNVSKAKLRKSKKRLADQPKQKRKSVKKKVTATRAKQPDDGSDEENVLDYADESDEEPEPEPEKEGKLAEQKKIWSEGGLFSK